MSYGQHSYYERGGDIYVELDLPISLYPCNKESLICLEVSKKESMSRQNLSSDTTLVYMNEMIMDGPVVSYWNGNRTCKEERESWREGKSVIDYLWQRV